MMKFLFVGSMVLIVFAYLGYPLSLIVLSGFRKKRTPACPREHFTPSLTVVITAYNEGKNIRQKLENTLSLHYPREKVQILVASDGSTDETNATVKEFQERGIELVALPERRGKENAQKEAIENAEGEIIVFTDTATILDPSALRQISSNFSDPTIGCVSSEDKLIGKDGKIYGEGVYVQYEMWLRRLESGANTVVGLSGSFFAARTSVCKDFSGEMQSDFRTLLSTVKMGYRGVSDPLAIGYYSNVHDEKQEFERKVRTILRGLTVFFQHFELLNIFQYGLFSYQFFCHKMLRWLVPIFLIILALSNIVLAFRSHIFLALLLCQLVFYGTAIAGSMKSRRSSMVVFKIPLYFLVVNASILMAWWKFLRGQRIIMWTPSER